ncbi:NAD(P)-dependent oxidoreductase [Pacificispira sp.]|uniref:NAD(P)-dependent oxidoreductase n=1 Tax=Pacificispira sp. TaxID=2888761 RepID=UPI003BAB34B3
MTDVTVIGLGPMGHVLAELLLKAGKSVTVWNRTAGKAAPLTEAGATLVSTPAEAIASSPVTVVCVYDYDAVDSILAADGVSGALEGRLLVNLGTGGPEDALRVGAHVNRNGGGYLDGAIQAAPSQMGEDDTLLLVSGAGPEFARAEPLLKIFAGNTVYLGEKPDAAAFMDLATLSFVYGSYAGFLHGARIAEATGIDVATYSRLVKELSPGFGAFFEHEGGVIASGDFRITESPLRISIPAVRRILTASQGLDLNTELPALVDGWLRRAEAEGLADKELASLIKVLRG